MWNVGDVDDDVGGIHDEREGFFVWRVRCCRDVGVCEKGFVGGGCRDEVADARPSLATNCMLHCGVRSVG